MNDKYVLDENGNPVAEPDLLKWAAWFDGAVRRVASDDVGDASVSTVFLGLDHDFGGGPPILWETMIFGGKHDGYQERYASRENAMTGHLKAVALAKGTPDGEAP